MKALKFVCAGVIAATVCVGAAKIKTRADADPQFDFKTVRTWAWHKDGPGEVKMARSSEDDPKAIQRRVEPTLVDAVTKELASRKLTPDQTAPDVRFHYYVLVTVGFDTQSTGQFLPAVPEWGIPPFTGATMSYNIIQTGSIVLDVVSTRLDAVVWRGIAQSELEQTSSDAERSARIREAVRDLIKKLPVK
jgi:hypothetical protein